MKRLIGRLVDERRWDDVLFWAERWIAFGQAPEPAYRALMVAHSGLGDISGVEGVYLRCVAVLDQEIGVKPSEETRDLYKQLKRGEKPFKASVTGDVQHVPPDIFPVESPAFLDAKAVPLVEEKGVFVGREIEIARLNVLLRRTLQGKGQIVFVIGEAGQGKTSLLNEFARRAQEVHPSLVVATGACDAYAGGGDAYLPFRDVMGMLTGDVENQWSAGIISRDHAMRLWRLIPTMVKAIVDQGSSLLGTFVSSAALAKRTAIYATSEGVGLENLNEKLMRPTHSAEKSLDQSHLFESYTQVLKTLAGQHPLVLIMDDLHWADVSSISLLFHLARRARDNQIFIVGAYRPEDVALGRDDKEHPLKGVLGEFKRNFGEIWVDLDRGEQTSGREFVDALLDTESNRLGESFRQELAYHTRGHPLFTVELLRDMQERGDLVHDEKGHWEVAPRISWDALPARVEGVIQKRVDRLKSDLRETLTVASVEGETFTAEVIARVLGVEEQVLVRELSGELDKRHRLVRATGIKRLGTQRLSIYRFRHSLFQGYLYKSQDQVERAYWHEAMGNELEKLYAQHEVELAGIAGQLARHFHEAGDDQRALKYYTQAGDRAVRLYAYKEARQFLQRALELSEADDRLIEQRIKLLENLADVQGLQGDSPDAIPLYQEALDLRQSVGSGDKWATIRLHRKIGEMWNSINSFDDFLRFETQAKASLETGSELAKAESPHPETVRLLMAVSKSALWGGPLGRTHDLETAEHSARAAVEMADQLDALPELLAALGSLARVYGARGLWRERVQVAQQRLNVSREAQFGDLRENLDILTQIGEALMGVGEYEQAISHLLEAEALGDQLQDVHGKAWALVIQSQCWLRLDRWDEILIAEEKLKSLQRRYPLERLGGICWLLSFSAVVHALRGRNKQARQLRHESYEIMIAITGAEQGNEEDWIREHHY